MGPIASAARTVFRKQDPRYAAWTVEDAKGSAAHEDQNTGVDDPNSTHQIFCEICYRYHSEINLTVCCQHQVCSGCLRAMANSVKTLTYGNGCPFCRCPCLRTREDIGTGKLANPGNQDDREYLEFRKKLQSEAREQ
jgi:hypothetical protein